MLIRRKLHIYKKIDFKFNRLPFYVLMIFVYAHKDAEHKTINIVTVGCNGNRCQSSIFCIPESFNTNISHQLCEFTALEHKF